SLRNHHANFVYKPPLADKDVVKKRSNPLSSRDVVAGIGEVADGRKRNLVNPKGKDRLPLFNIKVPVPCPPRGHLGNVRVRRVAGPLEAIGNAAVSHLSDSFECAFVIAQCSLRGVIAAAKGVQVSGWIPRPSRPLKNLRNRSSTKSIKIGRAHV